MSRILLPARVIFYHGARTESPRAPDPTSRACRFVARRFNLNGICSYDSTGFRHSSLASLGHRNDGLTLLPTLDTTVGVIGNLREISCRADGVDPQPHVR